MVSQERIIKKYPNRRLYDTVTSTYITLADVKQLVMEGCQFKVIDAKTSEDLTRSILLQIITEEESNGKPIFSSQMLYQIIQFYGNAFQQMMSSYLEKIFRRLWIYKKNSRVKMDYLKQTGHRSTRMRILSS